MTLSEIIERVALRQGVSVVLVEGFVLEVVDEIVRILEQGGEVKLRGLGTLHWRKTKGRAINTSAIKGEIPEGQKLKFTPARRFRTRRKDMSESEEGMTKLGVVLDEEKTKQASAGVGEGNRCPTCQRKLDDAGACPVHGTEPLEPSG